jgi:hypothetical protein
MQQFLLTALVQAVQANTAAQVLRTAVAADAAGISLYELDAWDRVIPPSPLYTDPVPEPVKQEPTGPRVYVQNLRGKQGHILEMEYRGDNEALYAKVQWYSPGARPVWTLFDVLTVIAASRVERCPNGRTGDECGSGENQCELCLRAEDQEADTIERSMGLR